MLAATAREGIERLLGEQKVRVLTVPQIARTFFQHTKVPTRSAREVLRIMASHGLVTLQTAMIHPEFDVSTPLHEYQPGDDPPDFGRVSWRAQSRFTEAPVRTGIVSAGSRLIPTARRRALRTTEILHDTILSAVFLNLVSANPSVYDRWNHEDARVGGIACGSNIPDAVLSQEGGLIVIECIGAYSADKIRAIHTAFEHLPYRLY